MQNNSSSKCEFMLEVIVEMAREIQSLQEHRVISEEISSIDITAFISACSTEFFETHGPKFISSENKYFEGFYDVVGQFTLQRLRGQFPDEFCANPNPPFDAVRWYDEDIAEALLESGYSSTPEDVQRIRESGVLCTFHERCVSFGHVLLSELVSSCPSQEVDRVGTR